MSPIVIAVTRIPPTVRVIPKLGIKWSHLCSCDLKLVSINNASLNHASILSTKSTSRYGVDRRASMPTNFENPVVPIQVSSSGCENYRLPRITSRSYYWSLISRQLDDCLGFTGMPQETFGRCFRHQTIQTIVRMPSDTESRSLNIAVFDLFENPVRSSCSIGILWARKVDRICDSRKAWLDLRCCRGLLCLWNCQLVLLKLIFHCSLINQLNSIWIPEILEL